MQPPSFRPYQRRSGDWSPFVCGGLAATRQSWVTFRAVLPLYACRRFVLKHTLFSLVLLTSFGAIGCGGDDSAAPICTGTGCVCTDSACTCAAGSDCKTECGDEACSLDCTTAAKCEGNTDGPLTLACHDTSQCKGSGGDGSVITCDAMSNCDFKAGANSTATCSGSAVCKINVGAPSSIRCQDQSSCNIKCDGDCAVTCTAGAECAATCGVAGTAATMCSDGRLVCGSC